MLLADEDASVVDGLGESQLEHLGLEATLEEVLDAQAEHVIELHLLLAEHADAHQASQKRVAFEESLRVLLLERKQLSGGLTDLGQRELDAPHLSLVAQTELADEFQLLKLWQEVLGAGSDILPDQGVPFRTDGAVHRRLSRRRA